MNFVFVTVNSSPKWQPFLLYDQYACHLPGKTEPSCPGTVFHHGEVRSAGVCGQQEHPGCENTCLVAVQVQPWRESARTSQLQRRRETKSSGITRTRENLLWLFSLGCLRGWTKAGKGSIKVSWGRTSVGEKERKGDKSDQAHVTDASRCTRLITAVCPVVSLNPVPIFLTLFSALDMHRAVYVRNLLPSFKLDQPAVWKPETEKPKVGAGINGWNCGWT